MNTDRKFKRRRSIVIVVVTALVFGSLGYLNRSALLNTWDVIIGADYSGPGHGEVAIKIAAGDDGADVAKALVANGVVKSYRPVYKLLISRNQVFYPGTYKLRLEMSSAGALDALADGANRVVNTVTIKEGWRIGKVLSALADATKLPLSDFQAAAKSLKTLGIPATEVSAEGWLFPATYSFDPDVSAVSVLREMVTRMNTELDKFGVARERAHSVLTLAALIQAEARRTDDFYKVSRVFLNRIEQGMKLQSDATVSYGVNGNTVSTTAADRLAANGYNTYLHEGLPIGPISAPGALAIDAALHPAAGKWLYFCAVNLATGETVFSNTYAEHAVAVKQWRDWMKANPGYE